MASLVHPIRTVTASCVLSATSMGPERAESPLEVDARGQCARRSATVRRHCGLALMAIAPRCILRATSHVMQGPPATSPTVPAVGLDIATGLKSEI